MSDAGELVRLIKKAAVDAVEAGKPAAVCFGRVTGTAPLKITVDERLSLGEGQLILTEAVKDRYEDVYFSCFTDRGESEAEEGNIAGGDSPKEDSDRGHRHGFSGRKRVLICGGLREGENVILLRAEGGQRFIVIDRLCGTAAEGEWVE
ncbi:MAG TPA: hypothetical protein DDX91_06425 [Ruminococcaceae bacterium]|nr:hypothetical protein [Oscillospiraceae bacterium]